MSTLYSERGKGACSCQKQTDCPVPHRPRNYSRVAIVVVFLLPAPSQIRVFIHRSLAVVPLVLLTPQKAVSASPSLTRIVSRREVGQRGRKPLERKPTYERDYYEIPRFML